MRYQRADADRDRALARAMSDGSLAVVRLSTVLPKFNTAPSSSRIPKGYLPRSWVVVGDK
jgi:hypothetical protein